MPVVDAAAVDTDRWAILAGQRRLKLAHFEVEHSDDVAPLVHSISTGFRGVPIAVAYPVECLRLMTSCVRGSISLAKAVGAAIRSTLKPAPRSACFAVFPTAAFALFSSNGMIVMKQVLLRHYCTSKIYFSIFLDFVRAL